MKTYSCIRILTTFSGILLAICTILTLCVWLYSQSTPRIPFVDMRELMVPASSFPAGWTINDSEPYPIPGKALLEDYHAEEGYIRTLIPQRAESPVGTLAEHKLFRYRNEWQAAEAFILDRPAAFYAFFADAITTWKEPDGWSYNSLVAKRFRFACVEFRNSSRYKMKCAAMAQYSEFVSVISTDVLPDIMTIEDVKHILRAIDEHMATNLGLDGK